MEAVKLVDIEKGLIEGWAIPFGGPMPGGKDLDGEAFTKDTELYLNAYPSRPLFYHHGKDSLLGFGAIGTEVKATRKEEGIWLEAQLNMAGQYKELLLQLLTKDMLGFSSGANPGSISKTADGFIKSWLWTETSLTPMPANPYSVIFAKSGGGMPNPNLAEQAALLSHLGHLPDASEMAVWMAEKTHENNNKPGAALVARIEALEADVRQREQAEMDEVRRNIKRLKEALDVAS